MHRYYLKHLRELEAESIYVIREVYAQFNNPCLLFSGAAGIIRPRISPRTREFRFKNFIRQNSIGSNFR